MGDSATSRQNVVVCDNGTGVSGLTNALGLCVFFTTPRSESIKILPGRVAVCKSRLRRRQLPHGMVPGHGWPTNDALRPGRGRGD